MHSNGEELHPNWRALATVHLPLKRFIKAADEVESSCPLPNEARHKVLGIKGAEAKEFYDQILAENSKATTVHPKISANPPQIQTPAAFTKVPRKLPFDKNKFYRCAQANDVSGLESFQLHAEELNSCDEFGWTALMVAACEGAVDSVNLLLKLGGDKTIKDRTGKNALDLARRKGHLAIVKILENVSPTRCMKTVQDEKTKKVPKSVAFYCEICNRSFMETTIAAHQTSTVHQFNIKSSIPQNKLERFNISNRNRGLQLMVKQGWDKESGLGPTQNGRLYPVKTVIRNQRTGLGIEQPPARVTHFQAFDLRATQRHSSDYYKKKPLNRNDMRREKVRDWKRNRRLRNELS